MKIHSILIFVAVALCSCQKEVQQEQAENSSGKQNVRTELNSKKEVDGKILESKTEYYEQDGKKYKRELITATVKAEDGADPRQIEQIKPEDVAELIRNPQTASEKDHMASSKIAKMTFVEDSYDFGFVAEGDTVDYVFAFTNDGDVPLIINNAKSSCGCTIPEWPKKPIGPGETSQIKASFRTEGKMGRQTKTVQVFANTNPRVNVVKLVGVVDPRLSKNE